MASNETFLHEKLYVKIGETWLNQLHLVTTKDVIEK